MINSFNAMRFTSMNIKAVPKLPFYIGLIFGIFLIGLAAKDLLAAGSATILAEQDAQLERDWDFKVHLRNVDILLKEAQIRADALVRPGPGTLQSMPERGRGEAEFRALTLRLDDDTTQKANLEKLQALVSRRLLVLGDQAGDVREGQPAGRRLRETPMPEKKPLP